MHARAATTGDLAAVFRRLADRMAAEYASAGHSKSTVQDIFFQNLKEGRAHALLDNGDPVAIISWDEFDGIVNTSFAAAESFFNASTVRFCKRHIRHIQALCGNRPIQSRSWSDRAEVARWFRVIGFAAAENDAGATVFELPPQALTASERLRA